MLKLGCRRNAWTPAYSSADFLFLYSRQEIILPHIIKGSAIRNTMPNGLITSIIVIGYSLSSFFSFIVHKNSNINNPNATADPLAISIT